MIQGELDSRNANIASRLKEAAAHAPERVALIVSHGRDASGRPIDTRLTYAELDRDSDRIAAGLLAKGITPGTRVLLMVPPGLDFFSLVFAVFKAGVVPIVIDPGIGPRAIVQGCRESAPAAMIGVRKALFAQRLLGFGRATITRRILAGPGGLPLLGINHGTLDAIRAAGTHGQPMVEPDPSALAAVLFTSGSTGPPKGVCYTHAIFQAQLEAFRALYEIEPNEIDLCTFPLFALYAPALGMTAVVPRMDPTRPGRVDPKRILEPLADYRATNLFGSPALLRRLVEGAEDANVRFPTLKRVVSAGAPASPKTLERLAPRLDPPAQIHTPYGATESLPVASIASGVILGETRKATDQGLGVCVGKPAPGIEVAIIPTRDDAIERMSDDLRLPTGETGEIAVAGKVVTHTYDNRPEATRLAKMVDASGRVWHRMGDLGRLDDQGRIWFLGRKSQRVVLGDLTLYTLACEGVFNTHPEVARSALVGARPARGVVVPVIWIEPVRRLGRRERARVASELLNLAREHPQARHVERVLFRAAFPVDVRHNSKIHREKLATWASRLLANGP